MVGEVLTLPLGKKKVSRITLASLEDMGYVVNYTAADPYGPEDIGVCNGCESRRVMDEISMNPCYQGPAYESAIKVGQSMLGDAKKRKSDITNLPDGIVFVGDQRIVVAYMLEDGTMCSTTVTP